MRTVDPNSPDAQSEVKRLNIEIDCISQMQWLIKDRPGSDESYRVLEHARAAREHRLAKMTGNEETRRVTWLRLDAAWKACHR